MVTNGVVNVKETLNTTELITADKAHQLINYISDITEDIKALDFSGIGLISLKFLNPLANYIVNTFGSKVTIRGLKDNQRELVREAFIDARRIQK